MTLGPLDKRPIMSFRSTQSPARAGSPAAGSVGGIPRLGPPPVYRPQPATANAPPPYRPVPSSSQFVSARTGYGPPRVYQHQPATVNATSPHPPAPPHKRFAGVPPDVGHPPTCGPGKTAGNTRIQMRPVLPEVVFASPPRQTPVTSARMRSITPGIIQAKRVFGQQLESTFSLLDKFAHKYFEVATYRKAGWKVQKTGSEDLTTICWAKAYLHYEDGGDWKPYETELRHSGKLIGPKEESSKGLRQVDGRGYTARPRNSEHNAFCAETQVLTELRRELSKIRKVDRKLIRFFTNYTPCAQCEKDLVRLNNEFENLEIVVRSLETYRASTPARKSTWVATLKVKREEPLGFVKLPRLEPR